MKRKIASLALSVAILGGGIATAMPANAAPATPAPTASEKSSYDNKIKTLKENLRIEKLRQIGNTTKGNVYDVEARNFHKLAAQNAIKANEALCLSSGVTAFGKVLETPKSKTSPSMKMIESLYKEKTLYANSSSSSYKISNAYRSASRSMESRGDTFKHQRETVERYVNGKYSTCYNVQYNKAKSLSTKYAKTLTAKDKASVSKLLTKMKVYANKEVTENAYKANKLNEQKAYFTISKKSYIASIESDVAKYESLRKAELAKKVSTKK